MAPQTDAAQQDGADVLVVDRGRLVYDGDLAGLVARVGVRRVVSVDLEGPAPLLRDVPGADLVNPE